MPLTSQQFAVMSTEEPEEVVEEEAEPEVEAEEPEEA
jgi:hypothetical protein